MLFRLDPGDEPASPAGPGGSIGRLEADTLRFDDVESGDAFSAEARAGLGRRGEGDVFVSFPLPLPLPLGSVLGAARPLAGLGLRFPTNGGRVD